MARLLQLAILATLALLTFAAPAPASPRSLVKRSFKAEAPGRRQRSGFEDVERTKNKYKKFWEVVIIGSGDDTFSASAAAPTSIVIPTSLYPIPYSTAASTIVVTLPSTPTPYGTGAPSSAPSSIPTGPPTYGNSTTTASSPSASSTAPAASSSAGSEDGTVNADPEQYESAYLSPVTIGGQKFNLDFDTGSSDLWVYGVDSVTSGRTAFNPSKSSSWKRLTGATWEIEYGDRSSAQGFVGTDVVDVGGSTVQKQAVEVAEQVSAQFEQDTDLDGLLGLSFSSLNNVSPKKQLTFFDNVKDDLTSPLFTADLKDGNGKGTYDFGTIDHSKYTGNIHYTPVDNSSGFWQITTPQMYLGEQSYDCSACEPGIVDTGTSLLYLNDTMVSSYYAQVPTAKQDSYGIWYYPCSKADSLPSFGMAFGDWIAHINGTDMNYSPYNAANTTCMGGLQSNADIGFSILGDVFLKQFFVVFDGGSLQVGFANQE